MKESHTSTIADIPSSHFEALTIVTFEAISFSR
jgi:hypothetical protein